MKALYFDKGSLKLVDKNIPEISRDEVLIRVLYAGVCATDLEILKGYMNFTGVPGHEFVGMVEKSSDPEFLNKRVVGEINLACGKCPLCLKGLGGHCPYRKVLGISEKDGAFAEFITLPKNNLHVIPPEIPDLFAVFVEPLAAACQVTQQLEILPEQRVLIFGDGKLGQLIAQVISLYTDKLLVVGKHKNKLDLLERSGIPTVLLDNFDEPDKSFHMVVEATGSWQGWELAVQKVLPRGFLVLKSTYAGEHPFNPAPLVINEINVVGSRCGPFTTAINLMLKKIVDPTELITGVYKIKEWERAFTLAQQPESLKIILDFRE